MGAAGFDGVLLAFGEALEFAGHPVDGIQKPRQFGQAGQPDGGRDGVVGRLPHVDVVVRVDRLVHALFSAQRDIGQVGDDFVGVHVVAGARARLEAVHYELVQIFPLQDALADLHNGVTLAFG